MSGNRYAIVIMEGSRLLASGIELSRGMAERWMHDTLQLVRFHPKLCAPDSAARKALDS